MLKKCGWFAAVIFTKLSEPFQIDIVFVALPQVPTVTLQFLVMPLRSALTCLGMPTPTGGSDDVMTKVKPWNIAAFRGKLPRTFPMQDLLDIWDQACTIVGEHHLVRLVSHVGLVNPDMALKHYSRCGPDDVTCATITFGHCVVVDQLANLTNCHLMEMT